MEIFNNREIALFIWTAIAFALICSKESLRKSLVGLFNVGTSKPLLKIYGLMLLYITVMIYSLSELGIWELSQTENTIYWVFSVAFISLFRANEMEENPDYFKTALRDNFRLIIVLEFIIAFYPFTLPAELILLPVMTLIVMMQVIAERYEDYAAVTKLLGTIQATFGIAVIGSCAYKLLTGLAGFASFETLADFYTPPLLSILFLPFLYFLSIYMTYERIFLHMRYASENEDVLRSAKWRSFFAFGFNTKLLKRWADGIVHPKLATPEDVTKSISDLRELITYEKSPRDIPPEEG